MTYGFTRAYCDTFLNTPFARREPATRFAQEKRWRSTFGPSGRWGIGWHNTCPSCAEGRDAVDLAVAEGRILTRIHRAVSGWRIAAANS